MRILALADTCNPEWTSLPVVVYKYAKALADVCDLTVVTHIRNRPNIEKAGFGKAKVVYIDTEWIAAPLSKFATFLRGGNDVGWTIQMAMDYPSYLAFERQAYKQFAGALGKGDYDVVHRLSPMSPSLPSPMASWSPVPFVFGPVNGNLPWPAQFLAERQREREWLSRFKRGGDYLPYVGSTFARSSAILAAFKHTVDAVPAVGQARTINYPEVGIDPELFDRPVRQPRARKTIVFAGRLVPYKLPDVVVQAFADSPILRQHQLVMLGEGPERPMIEELVATHDLAGCVELRGHRPQAEVAALMRDAEIFAFPSIRELGAGAVIEAMACGMVVVAVDYGGPAELLSPERGVLIPIAEKSEIVRQFRLALEALVDDTARCEQLGLAAYDHALHYYTWQAKAEKTVEIYDWVLGRRSTKPDFWIAPQDAEPGFPGAVPGASKVKHNAGPLREAG